MKVTSLKCDMKMKCVKFVSVTTCTQDLLMRVVSGQYGSHRQTVRGAQRRGLSVVFGADERLKFL